MRKQGRERRKRRGEGGRERETEMKSPWNKEKKLFGRYSAISFFFLLGNEQQVHRVRI